MPVRVNRPPLPVTTGECPEVRTTTPTAGISGWEGSIDPVMAEVHSTLPLTVIGVGVGVPPPPPELQETEAAAARVRAAERAKREGARIRGSYRGPTGPSR